MTDEEYAVLKGRVEALALLWSARLGLRWWEIDFVFCREGIKDEDHPGAAALSDVRWQYLDARIRFDMPLLWDEKAWPDEKLEQLVLHELAHVLVNELRCAECQHDDKKDVMDHEERVVTTLGKAFRWVYEAGQGVFDMPKGKHLPGVGKKANRQYEHIRDSELKAGKPLAQAKSIAAATVHKGRKKS